VAILLGWMTFAAGGVYPWVWIPGSCGTLALASRVRWRIASREGLRAVDIFLIATVAAILVQLVPLPYVTLQRIDPHAVPVRLALWLLPPGTAISSLPITIVPRDTWAALGIFASAALVFWTCRRICEAGGTGRIVRAIAAIGIVASLAAIAQHAENQELLYGFWRPIDAGARPYGPFVNRNHFATWAIMACPVLFGYLLARAPEARDRQRLAQRIVSAAQELGSVRVWLASAVCLLTLAVLLSTSRSGLIGLTGAFVFSQLLSRRHRVPQIRRWTILQAVLLALVVLSFANFDALLGRVDQTIAAEQLNRGRGAIWRDAERVIRDFRFTGTGAGTFGTAIIPYQTAEPEYTIGQAHNHYLQLAAEGGALVALPVLLAAGSFLLLFHRRLTDDVSANFLIRAGAAAGLAGALLQSFWETGLRMPANATLFAMLAAIATHTPAAAPGGGSHTH
jgi:O-Antigen ligase